MFFSTKKVEFWRKTRDFEKTTLYILEIWSCEGLMWTVTGFVGLLPMFRTIFIVFAVVFVLLWVFVDFPVFLDFDVDFWDWDWDVFRDLPVEGLGLYSKLIVENGWFPGWKKAGPCEKIGESWLFENLLFWFALLTRDSWESSSLGMYKSGSSGFSGRKLCWRSSFWIFWVFLGFLLIFVEFSGNKCVVLIQDWWGVLFCCELLCCCGKWYISFVIKPVLKVSFKFWPKCW